MHIIIAPSAFKDSLTTEQCTEAIIRGLERSGLNATWQTLPIADGGNGTLSAFLANGGVRKSVTVNDPLGRPINAEYGILPDGETAIIEMALASGLELLTDDERNPLNTSTYGTGELLKHTLDLGIKRVIIGMGGSATVDGGAGCLQALGVKFLDNAGQEIPLGGGYLDQVYTIDTSNLDPRWQDIEVIIASDVDNPTLGENGASYTFAPQKGANPAQVAQLEAHLTHFFELIYQQMGIDVRKTVGGGAAGALSAGLMAFLGGKIESGIDLLLTHTHFKETLQNANLVITGEGKMDSQTLHGKGAIGVAKLAKKQGVPTVAIVGGLDINDAILHQHGIHAVLPIVSKPMSLQSAIEGATQLVEQTALRLGYLLQLNR